MDNSLIVKKGLIVEALKKGKLVSYKEKGYSMMPLITPNSLLFIKPVQKPIKIQLGDIILYNNSVQKKLIAHRLITKVYSLKNQKIYITKGDNKKKKDPSILPCEVLGKVIKIKRKKRLINLELPVFRFINYVFAKLSYRLTLSKVLNPIPGKKYLLKLINC